MSFNWVAKSERIQNQNSVSYGESITQICALASLQINCWVLWLRKLQILSVYIKITHPGHVPPSKILCSMSAFVTHAAPNFFFKCLHYSIAGWFQTWLCVFVHSDTAWSFGCCFHFSNNKGKLAAVGQCRGTAALILCKWLLLLSLAIRNYMMWICPD